MPLTEQKLAAIEYRFKEWIERGMSFPLPLDSREAIAEDVQALLADRAALQSGLVAAQEALRQTERDVLAHYDAISGEDGGLEEHAQPCYVCAVLAGTAEREPACTCDADAIHADYCPKYAWLRRAGTAELQEATEERCHCPHAGPHCHGDTGCCDACAAGSVGPPVKPEPGETT